MSRVGDGRSQCGALGGYGIVVDISGRLEEHVFVGDDSVAYAYACVND